MTLFVPICAALVTVADANSALRHAGFDIVVEEVDLLAHRGFLPVRLEGQLSGFEYYIDDASEFETPAEFGACPQVVMLNLSLDHEVVAALAFAGVLAQSTHSGVLDPQEDRWFTPDEALASARAMSATMQRPFEYPESP